MALLTADQIRKCKRRSQMVPVPEWGGEVLCWEMSAVIHEQFAKQRDSIKDGVTSYRAEIVSVCLGDEEGRPLFTIDQVEYLEVQSSDVIQRLFDICSELNGLKEAKKLSGE